MVYWPGYLLIIFEVIPISVHGIQAFAFSTGGGKWKKKNKKKPFSTNKKKIIPKAICN